VASFSLKLIVYIILILVTIVVGSLATYTVGNYYQVFNLKKLSYLDAVYFTVTTLSTVGSNIVPDTNLGMIFETLLIISGLGVFLGALSLIAGEVMEDRMDKLTGSIVGIQKRFFKNHIVLIGTDSVNLVLAENLKKLNKNFIILSSDSNEVDKLKNLGYKAFMVDVTSEAELKKFTLEKAFEIIIDMSNSSMLLYTFLVVNSISKESDKIIIIHSQEAEKRLADLNLPANCTIINPSSLVAVNIINSLTNKPE